MILPSKHIPEHRSLAAIGGEILAQLDEPRAVSEVWERVLATRRSRNHMPALPYDWFILAMTFLFAIFAIEQSNGLIHRAGGQP